MYGGVTKAGWAAILASGLMLGAAVPAQSADLGGDCCADLEERVAELEATTARKGNRKFKLEIYGKVNQAMMLWDDGSEQNAYFVTNDAARTRFGFRGGAKINDEWSANFRIEIGVRSANSKRDNQNDPLGDAGLDIRHAWWNLKSKTWGTFQVGHTPTASQEITEANLAGTGDAGKYSDVEDSGGGFLLVPQGGSAPTSGTNTQWRRLIGRIGSQPGEGDRRAAIMYSTPEFAGFKASAAWGGDDFWDVGLRFEKEVGEFEIEAGIAYGEMTDSNDDTSTHGCPVRSAAATDAKCQMLGGSISVMHKKTGLYGNFAAGQLWDDLAKLGGGTSGSVTLQPGLDDTYTFWAAEAGIQQKWNSLGKTTLFGQYYSYDGGAITQSVHSSLETLAGDTLIASSGVDMWGLGVMQKIDAADMKLYALYRHYEFDMSVTNGTTVAPSRPLEDFQVLMTGAAINF